MATQTSKLTFTGRLNDVIGYRRHGVYYFRSRPAAVRQTTATKAAARRFGVASRSGRLIRQAYAPLLNIRFEGSLVNRLNKALVLASSQPEGIACFRFNQHTGLDRFFQVLPFTAAGGEVRIPMQVLPAIKKATRLEVKLMAVRIDFATQRITGTSTTTQSIDLEQPFMGISLQADLPGKGTLILTLQVRAVGKGLPGGEKANIAADIISITKPTTPKRKSFKKKHRSPLACLLPYTPLPTQRHTVVSYALLKE
ncbi:hypothetical protein KTO58_12160 [Chitinophaga pendula]|uniref:hypothetical protein n=1 Tax=Chitinophaga TaxID=79328 RepID=UPI000BAED599|nr:MULTISPECIES: hypothetical protein [Chitinophaga]ASZ12484.1 hypothetical protein CK934_16735 [Chitinophaga sp. MD30]UCJ09914.1 hypothetical protein KTO58_12160 [Chitinophaga pendula]